MIKKTITILNKAGLHTRPAAILVKLAAEFKSDFFIFKDDAMINGKSIIGVMTLAAEQGSQLELQFEGEDEVLASKKILEFFNNGFDEPR